MQLVSQEVCACSTSMTIVDSKERTSRPLINLLEFRFDDIQNDGDSIFIVVSDNTLMCISCVAANYSILLAGKLSWMVRTYEAINLFLFHLHIFLLLLNSNYESSIRNQIISTL